MQVDPITNQRQVNYSGKSREVTEVLIQRLVFADKRDDSRVNVKVFHVSRWSIGGRGYPLASSIEVGGVAHMKVLEEMGTAPNGPSFTDGRVRFESVPVVRCIIYDVVEEFLRESWRHGEGGSSSQSHTTLTLSRLLVCP